MCSRGADDGIEGVPLAPPIVCHCREVFRLMLLLLRRGRKEEEEEEEEAWATKGNVYHRCSHDFLFLSFSIFHFKSVFFCFFFLSSKRLSFGIPAFFPAVHSAGGM